MSRYYGGRRALERMCELPDDALRCIREQLVPTDPSEMNYTGGYVQSSNEEFIEETLEYFDESTTEDALLLRDNDDLREVLDNCDNLQADMGDRIEYWHQRRGNVAKRLPMVSRQWLHALGKPMNLVVAEIAQLEEHKIMLQDNYNSVAGFIDRYRDY